ncbi:MAG: hypothetical protein NBKEAIPA_02519 [Nitrospirae bacterium]|nr:hypothetical protein [Nitrospirota bacterium]MCE7965421.1 hypothetical protein [Nitrospira sp. NTP2]MCK6493047.1 copper-binding protein [Nitrospira sp.]MEB2338394.1 hypothetical protein [Nitrospirales bacterium]QOJ36213.1 MAG: hypothetical protein HRU82_15265 [Nitrospira sp.]
MLSELLSVILSLASPTALIAAPTVSESALLGGTIVAIDQDTLLLTIRMPSGESRALPVTERRLLQQLSVGDHIAFELNDEQHIVKILKLPVDPAN